MAEEKKANSAVEETKKIEKEVEEVKNTETENESRTTGVSSPEKNVNSNAMICWLVVALFGLPIPSFIWMNDEDEDLRWHAKTTLYFALVIIGAYVITGVVFVVGSMFIVGACCGILFPVIWLAQVVVGVMGAIKANKGEKFEIPVIKDWVK